MVMTQCGHFGHETCLKQWFQITEDKDIAPSCPLCRTKADFYVEINCTDCGITAEDKVNPLIIRIETHETDVKVYVGHMLCWEQWLDCNNDQTDNDKQRRDDFENEYGDMLDALVQLPEDLAEM